MWHYRLSHVSSSKLRSLISRSVLGSVSNEQFDCASCQLGKHHTLPFNNSDSTLFAPFDLIHSDIWGPIPTPIMEGSKYFMIFMDDFSHFTWLYFMRNHLKLV